MGVGRGMVQVTARVVALLIGLSGVAGLGSPRAAAEFTEIQNCTAPPELAVGATGPSVHCLQFALIVSGYDAGYSGVFDAATESAVFWYQVAHPPLNPDGRAGARTLDALGINGPASIPIEALRTYTCLADATIDPFERGQSVTCLQQRLTQLGFYQGSISGFNDTPTQLALRAFQRASPPIGVDGLAGSRTLAALGIWSGISASAPTPFGGPVGPGPFPAPLQPEPYWNLTAQGIPYYGSRTACTPAEAAIIAAEFARDGADATSQQWAVYIASREGGCRYDAVNNNPRTRDDSHCTFQINALAGIFSPHGELGRRGWSVDNVKASLSACADAASDLWVFCGRGPWTPPYSCTPPWAGSSIGLAPANIPTTTTTEPEPVIVTPPEPVPPVEPPEPPSTVASNTVATTTTPATTTPGP